MAASYYSGSAALPLQVHGRMLGGFQTDANGAYASLPVVGQAGAGGTPVADDATSGDALSSGFSVASGSILMALNYLDSQSGRTATGGAAIAVATVGNSDVVSLSIEGGGVPLGAHTLASTSVLAGAANAGATGKFTIASLSTFQASEGLAASAGELTVDVDGSSLNLTGVGKVEVKDLGISTGKIAAAAVTVAKIEDVAGGSLLVRDDAAAGVLSEFALTDTQIMIGDGAGMTAAALGGDITMTNAGVTSIGADKVITAKILDKNVTLAKIEDAAANTVLVRDANSTGVLSAKVVANTQLLIGDGAGFTAASLSGDVTMLNTGAVAIGATKVTSAMLNADVYTTSHTWTSGAQKFDTDVLRIKGSDADGNANQAFSFKVDGGILVLTDQGAF